MGVCPVCNGLTDLSKHCPSCGMKLEDNGRVMDFFDDYSPYMPIDLMKLLDGYASDFQNQQCPHLLKCSSCQHDEVVFIQE